jgi:hypothetical protein
VERTHHFTNSSSIILNRFRNPRIVTNGKDIHVSYYDLVTRSLKYWYNYEGNRPSAGNYYSTTATKRDTGSSGVYLYPQRWINLDGGWEYNDTFRDNQPWRVHNVNGRGTADKVGGNTNYVAIASGSQRAAGEWNAIDINSNGYPVIVYWDATVNTLRYAYSNTNQPVNNSTTASGNSPADHWATALILGVGTRVGQYVSMKIDNGKNGVGTLASLDRMHIAYYDAANNALMYLRGERSGNAYTFGTPVTVDNTSVVGQWTDISLDSNGNPCIVYEDLSKRGSTDGIRMAYLPAASDADNSLYQTSANWETMSAPLWEKTTAATRLNIENGATGAYAAVGYQADDRFRIAYFLK